MDAHLDRMPILNSIDILQINLIIFSMHVNQAHSE